jgi:hypothetical protein
MNFTHSDRFLEERQRNVARRQELAARSQQNAQIRLNAGARSTSTSTATSSASSATRAVASRLTAFENDPRWLSQVAENRARADRVRAARKTKATATVSAWVDPWQRAVATHNLNDGVDTQQQPLLASLPSIYRTLLFQSSIDTNRTRNNTKEKQKGSLPSSIRSSRSLCSLLRRPAEYLFNLHLECESRPAAVLGMLDVSVGHLRLASRMMVRLLTVPQGWRINTGCQSERVMYSCSQVRVASNTSRSDWIDSLELRQLSPLTTLWARFPKENVPFTHVQQEDSSAREKSCDFFQANSPDLLLTGSKFPQRFYSCSTHFPWWDKPITKTARYCLTLS